MEDYTLSNTTEASSSIEYNYNLLQRTKKYLEELAQEALRVHGMNNDELTFVCIQVNSNWNFLASDLAGETLEELTEINEYTVVVGCVFQDFCKEIALYNPTISKEILEAPFEGRVKVIVLSTRSSTVFQVCLDNNEVFQTSAIHVQGGNVH